MAYAAGAAMGPVIGGWLTDKYGFRGCADIIAVFTLIYAAINFCLVFVPNIYKKISSKKVAT